MANDPSFTIHSSTPFMGLCEALWAKYYNDCSGFARAVAEKNGVFLLGDANDIVRDIVQTWTHLPNGAAAAKSAAAGNFVIGGLSNPTGHGHVVVVVPGPLKDGNPKAYWGQLHELSFDVGGKTITVNAGAGRRYESISAAWRHDVIPHVIYRSTKGSSLLRGF